MLPFKLTPACKDYLWGGTRLKTEFGKETSLAVVAESWELSAHPAGPSIIATGPLAGTDFAAFVSAHPAECGTAYKEQQGFPVLIKFIDAQKSLSIQVHPSDEYARRVEGEAGKTEMWIILDCAPGAFLYFGFEQPIAKEEMRARIENNTLTEVLHKQYVKKGDVVFIPAGTIHAIGEGIVLAEIQQSSNSTYRVYDFGRLGPDGKPRELHVEKALDVTILAPANPGAPGAGPLPGQPGAALRRLAACPYFTVDGLALAGEYTRTLTGESFASVLCTGGSATLASGGQTLPVQKGDSVFVPATAGSFALQGEGDFVITGL
ncbi:MAG: type I phosphomannose isomerase catalytic subunit [Oscillospiraceae bacterium]